MESGNVTHNQMVPSQDDWLRCVIGSKIQAITSDPGCLCLVLSDASNQSHLLMLSVEEANQMGIRVISLTQNVNQNTSKLSNKPRRWSLLPSVG